MPGELVLIVEDNEKNLKLARDLLHFHGFRTLEAGTAQAGIVLAGEHLPDLVLMDIQLPDVDGRTALRLLRSEPRTASLRVVALTAFAMDDDRQRLLDGGFDGYISKPVDVKQFPLDVQRHCDEATRREESEHGQPHDTRR